MLNLKQYEQTVEEILQGLLCVCGHVASCKVLNCPHRRPHAVFACPILGLYPESACKIDPKDKVTCVRLDMQVVVHGEREI